MKLISLSITIIFILFFGGLAFGEDVYVRGYTKKNGTYVLPHYRSSPNGTVYDNWSTKGNVNPYTGQRGTKNPYQSNSLGFRYKPLQVPRPDLTPPRGYTKEEMGLEAPDIRPPCVFNGSKTNGWCR